MQFGYHNQNKQMSLFFTKGLMQSEYSSEHLTESTRILTASYQADLPITFHQCTILTKLRLPVL